MKTALLAAISGWMLLKIRAFRVVQIVQHRRMAISMKNCEWIASLRKIIASGNSATLGISTPISCQHCFANSQCRKRWCTVFSVLWAQRTQLNDWRSMFLLFRIFLVLSLSFKSSQKKDSVLWLTKAIPDPSDRGVMLWLASNDFVSSWWRKCIAPRIFPYILFSA